MRVSTARRQLQYKLVLNNGLGSRRDGTYIAAAATWLQLPSTDLQWLVDTLYEWVDQLPPQEEARRLEVLGERAAWAQPRHQLMADLVRLNGLGKALWCCAPVTLEMLRAL